MDHKLYYFRQLFKNDTALNTYIKKRYVYIDLPFALWDLSVS